MIALHVIYLFIGYCSDVSGALIAYFSLADALIYFSKHFFLFNDMKRRAFSQT